MTQNKKPCEIHAERHFHDFGGVLECLACLVWYREVVAPAELKRVNLQVGEAQENERNRILTRLQEFKCSKKAEECTARHIGYNLAIEDCIDAILGEIEDLRQAEGISTRRHTNDGA